MAAWFRIDNRLIHGQIIEAWLPHLGFERLVVVNDELAADKIQQQIMQLAIPSRICVDFLPVSVTKERYSSLKILETNALFLFANCQDVVRLLGPDITIPSVNVGNMHYGPGKRQLCMHVAASEDDLVCLMHLRQKGVQLDFRAVPDDDPVVEDW